VELYLHTLLCFHRMHRDFTVTVATVERFVFCTNLVHFINTAIKLTSNSHV